MSNKEDNIFAFAMGILGGVVGGVVAGLLLAPKSGEETREDIKRAVDNLSEKVSPEINEAKKQALNVIETSRCKLEREYKKFNNSLKAQKLAKAKNMENDMGESF